MKNEDAWRALRVAVNKVPQRNYTVEEAERGISAFQHAESLRMDILVEIRRVIMGGRKP